MMILVKLQTRIVNIKCSICAFNTCKSFETFIVAQYSLAIKIWPRQNSDVWHKFDLGVFRRSFSGTEMIV